MYTYTPLVHCAVTEAIGKVVNGGTVCRWRILSVKCSDSCSRFISSDLQYLSSAVCTWELGGSKDCDTS